MRQNTQPEKQSLTPMQKQAVLVCIVCALAALLTIGITLVLIHRGKEPAASSEQPGTEQPADDANIADHYQINEQSSALLPETADAGDAYQSETLFIGDSNTVRLYANGLISLQQFCAKEGIGTSAALNEGIVTFKKDSSRYTIAEAVAKMKPRRVVIMLGTNDTGMAVEDFISNYKQLVQAIQTSYPYTDIIVNTVPPVPADHSNYPNMDQTRIDDFNMALLSMCEEMGLKFLNTAEALKDSTGYGNADYYQSGDIHLKTSGLKVLLNYLRTHAYETEDRRPDTNNIPSRAEYVPDPSSAVASSSSEVTSASSEVQEDTTQYQASYRVDKTGGGTLSAGNDNGKTTLTYSVGASQSVSVTAVPASGYVFVKWSDGVTQKTRTDTNFKQNVDVTAVFAAASVHISSTGKAVLGDSYTFTAKLGGKHLTADSIRWYANGAEVPQAAGKTTVKVEIDPSMLNATFKVYAVASYNGCTVTSNVLNVTVSGVSSGSSSHSSGSSGSTSGSSSSGSTSSSGASSGTTSGASSGATSTSGSSSHSSSDSSSHSSSSSESTASPAGSASASNGTASSSHSTSSSHADSGESSSASHSSSGSESSSGSSHAASESNASKEAANEQSASTDSAS